MILKIKYSDSPSWRLYDGLTHIEHQLVFIKDEAERGFVLYFCDVKGNINKNINPWSITTSPPDIIFTDLKDRCSDGKSYPTYLINAHFNRDINGSGREEMTFISDIAYILNDNGQTIDKI